MSNQKLKFEDLEYIVMEGGGARGAAYLGAVIALEEQMHKRYSENTSSLFLRDIRGLETEGGRTKYGLLDYYKKEGNDEKPVIKGIAGSSAGAITTFALALGLNSKEIKTCLEYDFVNFLKEVDSGRYRMIDEDNKLAIGEDKKNRVTGKKELSRHKEFNFRFDADKTNVGGNLLKRGVRNLAVTLLIKTLSDGVGTNVKQLGNWDAKFKNLPDEADIPVFWRGLYRWCFAPKNVFLQRLGWYKLGQVLLFKLVVPKLLKTPIPFNADSIANVFYDRGMYSGFAVREFFMDMLLMALTKKTAFHRGFLKHLGNKFNIEDTSEIDKISKQFLSISNFEIGKRSKSKFRDVANFDSYSKLLQTITFSDLFKITGVNFVVCVSNFTTGCPLYFSKDYTPDFLVMEAVAASMSIPPAIKPLYNTDNVVKPETGYKKDLPFVKNGKFDLAGYYFYEHIVKLYIAQENDEANIDANNTIDMSAFLKPLKDLVIEEIDETTNKPKVVDKNLSEELKQPINGVIYKVTYNLLVYFYNAAYKGLLIDGGYRNNIPYNIFRTKKREPTNNKVDDLKGVLAIKLDNHFPPDLLEKVYKAIKEYVELSDYIDNSNLPEDDPLLNALLAQLNKKYELVYAKVEVIFANHLMEDIAKLADPKEIENLKDIHKQIKKNNKAIKKLTNAAINDYQKNHLSPPWTEAKSIIATASEGYAYGSEKGQVQDITDHNHIVPLYDYGVGTFDFDMSKVQPQIRLAQAMAQHKVYNFFE